MWTKQRMQTCERTSCVLVPTRLHRIPAKLSTRMRGERRMPAEQSLPPVQVHRSLPGNVRHGGALPGREPQSDLQLPVRLHGRSVRPLLPSAAAAIATATAVGPLRAVALRSRTRNAGTSEARRRARVAPRSSELHPTADPSAKSTRTAHQFKPASPASAETRARDLVA